MGNAVTIELCDLCGKEFHLPMKYARNSGGYMEESANLELSYNNDAEAPDIISTCCPNCLEKLRATFRNMVILLKTQAEVK